ncbi:hypothetical protein TNCV_4777251 [Trichonephila clavipes]|nr:hypothetical protein TNCV_4777251 [Trichonephila clavipes]
MLPVIELYGIVLSFVGDSHRCSVCEPLVTRDTNRTKTRNLIRYPLSDSRGLDRLDLTGSWSLGRLLRSISDTRLGLVWQSL